MSERLHLRRLNVRYRVADDDPTLRRTLDGVLHRVLDRSLEPALQRAGVPLDEEICVRALRVPVRVRLAAGEAGAADAWSEALARALAVAIADGSGPNIVRYRSRRAALADLALGVAAGRLEHAWAWRQLGLWRGGDAPGERAAATELVSALVAEPEAIVAVLAELEAAGALGALVGRLEPSAWVELARVGLAAAGTPAAALPCLLEPVHRRWRPAHARSDRSAAEEFRRRAAAVARSSAIARALARGSATLPGRVALALAALAWLESFPDAAPSLTRAALEDLVAESAATPRPAAPAEDHARELGAEEEHGPRWATTHGGLLFLLAVLDELAVPDELGSTAPLAGRPLRWSLHRLAMTLAPVDARDPAALAFAGLPPQAEPPDDGGEPWGDAELDALAGLRDRVEAELKRRLERPDAEPGELLELVCRRSGEVIFDHGWIELRLPLDEASPDLRRAGLDLDPGWIAWLGAVVRFVYV
jgi:hypothetical protein